ncbi:MULTISPECIES: DUF1254 domain-containing protein [Oerskovia]|uniref:DUF1254 domain-containing protein n=1 Tax=Oerskovia rustica TaxID=2762237 RepID=A0ABR8RWR3_9CELL|nr:DUF1254 domain-containing protein [Oerskovia rustica]MBD7952218.1 DUF1254 domain-containing protein [Oerskovia rustica]
MGTLSNDLRTLSHEAYVYLYPLVTMDLSRRQATNVAAGVRPGFGPPNVFHHLREFPPADFRAVVRPNFDTLYANLWLDLTDGPVLLHVPDTDDRYYMLPLLDMWTEVFATIGKRTTGTGAGDYLIVGPDYEGDLTEFYDDLPEDVALIVAPTPQVWVIGRIQTNGVADYPAVHAVQDGLSVQELGERPPFTIDPTADTRTEPLHLVDSLSAVDFFTYATRLLDTNPPHLTDFSVLARIGALGIVPGEDFDAGQFDDAEIAEIEAGAESARALLDTSRATLGTVANGWMLYRDTMGVYGNFYLKRAVVTLVGLGANPVEDAIYPLLATDADGQALNGDHDYVLHFDADQLPPAAAFWSVTMYDAEGYQVANALDRFAIGDRDDLQYGEDGSLDLYLQHESPRADREANWLPAPRGPLGVTMRLYAPLPEALDGRWVPPVVRRV